MQFYCRIVQAPGIAYFFRTIAEQNSNLSDFGETITLFLTSVYTLDCSTSQICFIKNIYSISKFKNKMFSYFIIHLKRFILYAFYMRYT